MICFCCEENICDAVNSCGIVKVCRVRWLQIAEFSLSVSQSLYRQKSNSLQSQRFGRLLRFRRCGITSGQRSAMNYDKPAKRVGRVIVNLTLEAISNNVSALPMSPLAQTSSGQTEIGGFAATLAAAQGLSSESSAASEPAAAGKIAETIAEKVAASAGTDPSAKGGQNAPLRKPLSSVASTRANTVLGVASNMVVPETVAAQAGAIAGLGSQISQGPALSATVSLPNSGGTGEDVSSRSLTAQPGGVAMASAAESASGVLRPAAGGFTLPEIIPPSTVLSATGPAANFPAHEPSGQTPKLQLQPAMDSPAPRSATVPEAAEADADTDSSSAALSSTAAEPAAGNQDATQLPLSLSSTLSSTSTSTAPAGLMQNAQPDAPSTSKLPASDTSGVTPASNLAAELQADAVQARNPQAGLKLSEPRVLPTNDSVPLAYNAKPETLPFTTAAATADKNTLTADTQATVQESADAGDVLGAGTEQFTPQPSQLQVTAETAPTADAPVLTGRCFCRDRCGSGGADFIEWRYQRKSGRKSKSGSGRWRGSGDGSGCAEERANASGNRKSVLRNRQRVECSFADIGLAIIKLAGPVCASVCARSVGASSVCASSARERPGRGGKNIGADSGSEGECGSNVLDIGGCRR